MFGIFAVSTFTPFLAFTAVPLWEKPEYIQEEVQQEVITHNWYATDSVIQDYVNYAYEIWGIDFVKLI